MSMEIFTSRTGRPPTSLPWRAAVGAWADLATPIARQAIKAKAPVGKGPTAGRLRDSVRDERHFVGSGLQVWIGSSAPEAPFVLRGTRAHEITPVNARALHFTVKGGDEVFARRVRHPGTKPNPFARDAMRRVAPEIRDLFARVMREAFGGVL